MDKKRGKQQQMKEYLTPEEILARAQRARWRFRATVRYVMQNVYWLEDVEDQVLGEDIQKNIALLTRKKEKKSLLSLQDKSLLNKPTALRTDEEKYHLSRIIGGLKCFRRYPGHVKSQLAGVTYFFYFGPGRVIVRQGDISHNLYFIITGEVRISQTTYDPILEEAISQDLAVMGPGSMFGEVSLLDDIPRTATITTNTHVELLCLKREDFNVILKATVKQQWEDVQAAIKTFTYFESWNDVAIRECCILAKMKAYAPEQTILGDGAGLQDFVYFILKGTCRVIEHLMVSKDVVKGRAYYNLYIPPEDPALDTDTEKGKQSTSTLTLQSSKSQSITKQNTKQTRKGSKEKTKEEDARVDKKPSGTSTPNLINLSSRPTFKISYVNLPKNVEIHFMQVCFLTKTACFGLGENMKYRRIVAVTHTECLLIPRYWLMQRNAGSIWNKIPQFLDKLIPSTKEVYKEFINQRKWLKHKKKLVNELMSRGGLNDNSPANIPHFIRIHEEIGLP